MFRILEKLKPATSCCKTMGVESVFEISESKHCKFDIEL
jgi:hypothetical protein